jgi:hypothetical protein
MKDLYEKMELLNGADENGRYWEIRPRTFTEVLRETDMVELADWIARELGWIRRDRDVDGGHLGELEREGDPGELEREGDPGELEPGGDPGELEPGGEPGELEPGGDPGELELGGDPGELELGGDPGELELGVSPKTFIIAMKLLYCEKLLKEILSIMSKK